MAENEAKLVHAVLQPYPDGILVSQLMNEYRGTVGCDIKYRAHGFSSLLEYLQSLNKICEVYQLSSGESVVRSCSTSHTSHLKRMVGSQVKGKCGYNQATMNALQEDNRYTRNFGVPGHLKTKLLDLLDKFDTGIDVSNLSTRFRMMHGSGICWKEMGCVDINDFIQNRLLPTGEFQLIDGKIFATENSGTKPDGEERKYLEFVVGEQYTDLLASFTQPMYSRDQCVSVRLKLGKCYPVVWTYVKSDQDFGFYLLSEIKNLLDLREDMQTYYDQNHAADELTHEEVELQSLVVIQENGFWCRGRVIGSRRDIFHVMLLDSGHKIWCNKVFKIQSNFLELPFQGICARLSIWTESAEMRKEENKTFKRKIKKAFDEGGLVAKVQSFQDEKVTVQLYGNTSSGTQYEIF